MIAEYGDLIGIQSRSLFHLFDIDIIVIAARIRRSIFVLIIMGLLI